MSIQTEILRIQTARNTLRTKGVELGIAQSTYKIDQLASAYENIQNQGAVSATVQEGDTYTIPKGYHNGSGTVSGIAGGGSYTLQSKTVLPTKQQQNITPDSGYYGISDVTVGAIPENYQDVSSVTALSADVLSSKVFVASDGTVTAGTMANNGTVNIILDTSVSSYGISKGYHSGEGTVSISPQEKTAVPSKVQQSIVPDTGKVISKVTVEAIPDEYQDVSNVTAEAENVLAGQVFVSAAGEEVTGTMTDNSSYSASIDGISQFSCVIPKGYHDGTGSVYISDDIENALAVI